MKARSWSLQKQKPRQWWEEERVYLGRRAVNILEDQLSGLV
jgi:hypothetical protein